MEPYRVIHVPLHLIFHRMFLLAVLLFAEVVAAVMEQFLFLLTYLVRKKSVRFMEIIVVFMMIQDWITRNVMSVLRKVGMD